MWSVSFLPLLATTLGRRPYLSINLRICLVGEKIIPVSHFVKDSSCSEFDTHHVFLSVMDFGCTMQLHLAPPVTGTNYAMLLHDNVWIVLCWEWPWPLRCGFIVLRTVPHVISSAGFRVCYCDWEVLTLPSQSPDLPPCNQYLLSPTYKEAADGMWVWIHRYHHCCHYEVNSLIRVDHRAAFDYISCWWEEWKKLLVNCVE
jgi:hypothetical protein